METGFFGSLFIQGPTRLDVCTLRTIFFFWAWSYWERPRSIIAPSLYDNLQSVNRSFSEQSSPAASAKTQNQKMDSNEWAMTCLRGAR